VRGLEIVATALEALHRLAVTRSGAARAIATPTPALRGGPLPIDPARFLRGWGEWDEPPAAPVPWQIRTGVLRQYREPGPLEHLETLAATASSAAREDASDDRTRAVVAEAAALLRAVDLSEDTTVLRALQAVETIGAAERDPLGLMYASAARVWEAREWPRTDVRGARKVLRLSLQQLMAALRRGDAARANLFASLLGAVAPSCLPDAATRLTWFAERVTVHLHEHGLGGAPIRDALTRIVGRWFGQLQGAPDCSVMDVALGCWRPEVAEYTHREAVDRWAQGALRMVSQRNGLLDLFAG
jgi:hypothetical protein